MIMYGIYVYGFIGVSLLLYMLTYYHYSLENSRNSVLVKETSDELNGIMPRRYIQDLLPKYEHTFLKGSAVNTVSYFKRVKRSIHFPVINITDVFLETDNNSMPNVSSTPKEMFAGLVSNTTNELPISEVTTVSTSDKRHSRGRSAIIHQGLVSEETFNRIEDITQYIDYPLQVFAIVCCFLSIVVYSRKAMTSPTSKYLIAINVVELLVVLSSSVLTIVESINGEKATSTYAYLFIALYGAIYFTVVVRRCSFCLTCLVSAERFIVVAFPLKAKYFRLIRNPSIFIGTTIVVLFVFHIYTFLKLTLVSYVTGPQSNETLWRFSFTEMYKQHRAGFEAWGIASKILFVYIQLLGCLILNICIVIYLRKHATERQLCNPSETTRSQRELQMTVTILVSTFIFVFFALPITTSSVVADLSSNYGLNTRNQFVFFILLQLGTLCQRLSNCTNFVSYMTLSSQFRQTFWVLFRRSTPSVPAQ